MNMRKFTDVPKKQPEEEIKGATNLAQEPELAYTYSRPNYPDLIGGEKYSYGPLLAVLGHPSYQGRFLLKLQEVSGLTLVYLAEEVFGMTAKTMNTYIKDVHKPLPARFTEHAHRLYELYNFGAEVLGDLDTMRRWMSRPAYGLHQRVPLSLINTLTGIEYIRDELVRIEFGATA